MNITYYKIVAMNGTKQEIDAGLTQSQAEHKRQIWAARGYRSITVSTYTENR